MGEILRKTTSICPECEGKTLPATIEIDDARKIVIMRKKCDKHGEYVDKLSDDIELYKWQNMYADKLNSKMDTAPTNIPLIKKKVGCPYDCGLCTEHKSAANFVIMDITNRCNLNCPICFANSNKQGRIVEYTKEQVDQIMDYFLMQKPYHAPLAQFSGGEPTLHPRIIDILNSARDKGFPHRMINTNGIRLAKDIEFFRKVKDTDCGAMYLSFDGLSAETYKKVRGLDLTKIKMKVIESAREIKYDGIMLVQTVCKGMNDHEVGAVLDFAKNNNDVVAGVVYQPVSLCGRVAVEDLTKLRYNNSDLIHEIERYTKGQIPKKTFYPLAVTNKMTQLLCWFSELPGWAVTAHNDCGFATLVQLTKEKEWKALENYADIEGLIKWAGEVWDTIMKREIPKPSKVVSGAKKIADQWGMTNILDAISTFSDKMTDIAYRKAMQAYFIAGALKYVKAPQPKALIDDKFYANVARLFAAPALSASKGMLMNGLMFIGSMHFQDAYDMDIERVKRCVVHYGVIDPANEQHVLQVPFCTFNSIHREKIEAEWAKKHAKPLDITPEQNAKEVQAVADSITLSGKKN